MVRPLPDPLHCVRVDRLFGVIVLTIVGLGPAPAHGQIANVTAITARSRSANESSITATCAAPSTGGCTACDACCMDISQGACDMCFAAQCANRCTGECNACDACCQPWFSAVADCDACVSATCTVHSPPPVLDEGGQGLLIAVLLPFFGRFFCDYILVWLHRLFCGEPELDFPTCIDRPFVQKEIRWSRQYMRPTITVFEDERRRQAFFDYGLAWKKYGGGEWESLLSVDSVTYRRDGYEAEAMVQRILAKAGAAATTAPTSESALNSPGHWDFFLSHGQAAAGDQVKTLSLLLKQRKKPDGSHYTVWYDNSMRDRSTAAMEEGVRCSDNFLLFLSGDPEMSDDGKGKEGSSCWKLFSQLCCCRHLSKEDEYQQLEKCDHHAQQPREDGMEQGHSESQVALDPEPGFEAMELGGQPRSAPDIQERTKAEKYHAGQRVWTRRSLEDGWELQCVASIAMDGSPLFHVQQNGQGQDTGEGMRRRRHVQAKLRVKDGERVWVAGCGDGPWYRGTVEGFAQDKALVRPEYSDGCITKYNDREKPRLEPARPVVWEKYRDDKPSTFLTLGRTVWVCTDYHQRLTGHGRDKIWQRGVVVDFEKDGSDPWPLVRVKGETEACPYCFIDPTIAPGFTFIDLLVSSKTWADAAERNDSSSTAALCKGLARLVFWHLLQPPLYFLVLVKYVDLIDPVQLGLGIAVGVREAIYFLSTLACCWANPAFLLVDVSASVRLGEHARDYEWRDPLWSGYPFLCMYVLAPEKYVGLSLASDGGLGMVGRNRGACGGCSLILAVALGVTSSMLDLCGVVALISGWRSGSLPLPLAVGYSVTTFALVASLLVGIPRAITRVLR